METSKFKIKDLLTIRYIKQNKHFFYALLITALFFLFNLYLLMQHESWLDEAQAWLIARDTDFLGLLEQVRYEGHPVLWFLFLMPFAKLGFPYEYIGLISLSVVTASVFLVLKYFPFGKVANTAVVLSSVFIYYNPVIARNYCLVLLLVVILAILYKQRKQQPLRYAVSIALLAQTHVLIFGFCLALYLLHFFELTTDKTRSKKSLSYLGSIFIPPLSFVFLIFELFGSVGANVTVSEFSAFGKISLDEILFSALTYFKHIMLRFFGLDLNLFFSVMLFSAVLGAVVVIGFLFPKVTFITTLGVGFVFAVHILIYQSFMMQKLIIAVLVIIFCLVTVFYDKPLRYKKIPEINTQYIKKAACLAVIIISVLSLGSLSSDIVAEQDRVYARSDEIAEFVTQNLPSDSVIVCPTVGDGSAIAPYLTTQKLFSPSSEQFFTYLTWDQSLNVRLTAEQLAQTIDQHLSDYQNIFILFQPHGVVPSVDGYPGGLEVVETFSGDTIQGEPEIVLYKVPPIVID